MKPNKTAKARYASVAEYAEAKGLDTDWKLGADLGLERSHAGKLRRGRGYRCLLEPLRIAEHCQIPIEALLPSEASQ
jgi:hypothetical protein